MAPNSPRNADLTSLKSETFGRSRICRYEITPTKPAIKPAKNIVNAAPLYVTVVVLNE